MSICIIHLSDGKVAGVYSNTHEPMEVMVMERDGPRMTEEQQARYRAFQTMVSVLPARAGRLWRSSRRKSGISLESTRMISSRYFWSCARRRTVQMPLGERSA